MTETTWTQSWKRRDFVASGLTGAALASGLSTASVSGVESADRIRIGQIGTKHPHALGKMKGVQSLPDLYQVVGLVEPDDEQWAAVGEKYEGVRRFKSPEELFAVENLQAVVVETDIPELVPSAKLCAERGFHIHLDKPAGLDYAGFRDLHRVAAESGSVIQMGYMFRYNPAFLFLFDALEKGWLGEVFEVAGLMSKLAGDSVREELAPFPGGVMFELACHLVDAVVAVLGEPEAVTPYLRNTFPEKDGVIDNALAVFEYPRAVATVRGCIVEPGGHRRRHFVVCGTKGTVEIRPLEPPSLVLTLEEPAGGYGKGQHEIELPMTTGRYDDEFRDLARMVRGEKAPPYSPEHDLAVQEALLRASGMWKG